MEDVQFQFPRADGQGMHTLRFTDMQEVEITAAPLTSKQVVVKFLACSDQSLLWQRCANGVCQGTLFIDESPLPETFALQGVTFMMGGVQEVRFVEVAGDGD